MKRYYIVLMAFCPANFASGEIIRFPHSKFSTPPVSVYGTSESKAKR